MAGPISRAFVQIEARIDMSPNSDLETAIRRQIREVETELNRLEGAARSAGAAVARQLKEARINLDVRPALVGLNRIEGATEEVVSGLRELQSHEPKFQTTKVTNDLRRLDDILEKVARSFQVVDGEELDLNVTQARSQLNALENAIRNMVQELEAVKGVRSRVETEQAVQELERLQATVSETLRDLARIDQSRVRVQVDDLALDAVQAKVNQLTAKTHTVKLEFDKANAGALAKAVDRINVNLNDFGDQFRNIAFRAASYLAVGQAFSAFQRIISLGVEAAGQIQTITVGLNKLFADMPQLGKPATAFLEDLRDLAIETPFEFLDLADASRRIVQLGGNADTAVKRLKDLADAGAAVGATSEDINGVIRALNQMAAKGRINLQDLNQVAERLPNFQRQMQLQGVISELEAMGSPLADTVDSFDDLREAGVPIETVINGIFRGLDEIPGAAGAAAAQARTLQGALSNLKDFADIEFAKAFKGVGATLADELNRAFDRGKEGATELQQAITDVIGAFGVGLDRALPDVIDFFSGFSDNLSELIDSIATVVESFATGFAGGFFSGLTDGLTGVINLVAGLNDAISALPLVGSDAFSGALGQVAAQMIAITRLGPNVFLPFQNAIVSSISGLKLLNTEVNGTIDRFKNFTAVAGSSLRLAGLEAVGLAALTVLTNGMADSARRAREFEQSIDSATQALDDFTDVGDAVIEFLDEFREKGSGVNIGELEKAFDGLTSGELERALGLRSKQLATLVTDLAKMESLTEGFDELLQVTDPGGQPVLGFEDAIKESDELTAALDRVGLTVDDLRAIGDDAGLSLGALADQLREGAQASFAVAIATERFAFAEQAGLVPAIVEATNKTGDYVAGLEALNEANRKAAQSKFGGLVKQLNLTGVEQRDVISNFTDLTTGTIDWVGAVGELQVQLQAIDDAMIDLEERAEGVVAGIDRFVNFAAAGFKAGDPFVSFAREAEAATLSAEEFDAATRRLGTTLTGEELAAAVEAINAQFGEFKTGLEGVIPSFDNLQLEADNFTLDSLIDELERIGEAQANVESNVAGILFAFGELGAQAIAALLESGLSPEQFAIAVQGLADGGIEEMERLVAAADTVGDDIVEHLAERLTQFGLTDEQIDEFLGITGFERAGEKAAAAFETGFGGLRPGRFAEEEEAAARAAKTAGKGAAPGVDVDKAVKEAEAAGKKIGDALAKSTKTAAVPGFDALGEQLAGIVEGFGEEAASAAEGAGQGIAEGIRDGAAPADGYLLVEMSQVSSALASFGGVLGRQAAAIGRSITTQFSLGLELDEAITRALNSASAALRTGHLVGQAHSAGFTVGFALGLGVASGIRASVAVSIAAVAELVAATYDAARAFAGISSPSKLFRGLGRDLGAGAAAGLLDSIPAISKAAATAMGAAASGASVPSAFGSSQIGAFGAAPAAAAMLRRTSLGSSPGRGASALATAPAPAAAGVVHNHAWNFNGPIPDPETLAAQVATRIERRVQR